jgi:anti-sigma factor RsiW
MTCDSWRSKLDAYADGELSPSEAHDVAAHLHECPNCAATVLQSIQLKRSVAAAGKRFTPSPQLREQIAQSIRVKPRRSGSWLWKLVLVPAALVALLSLGVNFYVGRETSRREHIYSELADLHVSTLASATPVDVISTDRHTVKPWFEGRIPFAFNLPELQGTDFTLLGGRVAYLAQEPGAQLIYRLRKHEISVFIFQDRALESMSLPSGTTAALSFHVGSWTQNGLRYFVVGDVGVEDIDALTNLLKTAS